MPCHTHERRMEVYFYFDLKDNNVVFHMMGEPTETRHLLMHNEQARHLSVLVDPHRRGHEQLHLHLGYVRRESGI